MKAFITVMGKDKVGIIASVSTKLTEWNINIEDISQTIMQGVFTMIMAVNTGGCTKEFSAIADMLKELGEKLGVEISIRSEAIFQAMHRI